MLVYKAGLFTLILGAGLISAQSLAVSLSSNCSDTLQSLLASPDAACMNLSPFLSLAIGAEKSIPVTVNNWLTGLCSSGTCSNGSLAAIVANVTNGCAQDLSSLGIDTSSLGGQMTDIVQQVYPTARRVLCLKDASKLCATQTLENLENVIGSLGSDDLSLVNLLGNIQKVTSSNVTNLACTNCTKEAMNIVTQDFPDIVSQSNIVQPVQNICGASFTDGNSPDGITETAAAGQFSIKLDSGALKEYTNLAVLLYFILAYLFAPISFV
ncbi:hypothetical protein BDQ17DRAFT_702637 [Cyathus striatus]|nr:hypothetical protein BDQ17DRAFT_702637 [Cyathus striatus]